MNFILNFYTNWDSTVFEFSWVADNVDLEKLFRQIEKNATWKHIVLDLSKLNFINSTLIGYIFHMYEQRKKSWGKFVISWCNQAVEDALNMTWVLDFIRSFSNITEALNWIEW